VNATVGHAPPQIGHPIPKSALAEGRFGITLSDMAQRLSLARVGASDEPAIAFDANIGFRVA
jgi:hypothetical protein